METEISIEEYANRINTPVCDLKGESKGRKLSVSRQVYWYYLSRNGIPKNQICRAFNRKHSTILVGIRKIEGYIDIKDKTINSYLEALDIFSL